MRPVGRLASLATLALAAGLAAPLAACRDATGGDTVPAPAQVAVTPALDSLAPGERVRLAAEARDSAGRTLAGARVHWSSSAPDVATVDSTGLVRAVAPGLAVVAAVVDGARGEARVVVRRVAASLEVLPATIGLGETVRLLTVLRDSAGVVIPDAALPVRSRDTTVIAADTGALTGGFNVVHARRMGEAVVAVAVDGRELTARVTVTAPRVAHVAFAFEEVVAPLGAERPLDVGVFVAGGGQTPVGPTGGRIDWPVTWRSADPGVASVDARGVVTGGREGTTVVTATSEGANGPVSGTVRVRVVRLAERPVFAALSAGWRQTCGLSTGGIAYCWGDASRGGQDGLTAGHLGLAVAPERLATPFDPLPVASLPLPVRSPVRFAKLAEGNSASGGCALTADGEAYCWNSPEGAVRVPGGIRFASLTASASHACGLTPEGRAYCWGEGSEGQLGIGVDVPSRQPVVVPHPVAGDLRFATISAGVVEQVFPYTCGLTVDGDLYCWGVDHLSPTRTGGGLTFRAVTTGGQTCAISTDDATYCWYGVTLQRDVSEHRVDGGHAFVSAAGSTLAGCGVERTGATWCWGFWYFGSRDLRPLAGAPPLRSIVFSSDFAGHVCGLTDAGTAYCWGPSNGFGQVGGPRLDVYVRPAPGAPLLHFDGRYPEPVRVMGQP